MGDKGWTWLFCIALGLNTALASFPGIFDWSNTIEPWVLGMPFASFWQLFLSAVGILCIAIYYFIDESRGTNDDDIPEQQ